MKAVVMRQFGGPGVLRLEEVETPTPGPGEVLIEVHAVSVNRTLDCFVRAGEYAYLPAFPHVLGCDPSGVIVAVGPQVRDREVGDHVVTSPFVGVTADGGLRLLGVNVWGGCAQYLKVPASLTFLAPKEIDFASATVVARHAPVAFTQLRDHAQVQPGQWVLVMGAAGGLGSAGVQVARYLGAKVIAAAGSDERVKAAVDLGADVGINYRSTDLTAEVKRVTGGIGAHVVLENIGDPELFPKALYSLARNGRMVTAGGHGGGMVPLDVRFLYQNFISIIGAPVENPAHYASGLRAFVEGRYRVKIDRKYPLSQTVEAHEYVESNVGVGKVIIEPQRLT